MSLESYSLVSPKGSRPFLFASPSQPEPQAPLVVFLHGAKDRGDNLQQLLDWGFPKWVNTAPELPYYWLALQIPADATWPAWQAELWNLIDQLSRQHQIARDRVILTGFSLGAAGAWAIAAQQPDRVAGLVVVSGRVPDLTEAEWQALARIPVWAAHGQQDDRVPSAQAQAAIDRLQALGGHASWHPVEGDHFIADPVFADPALQAWLADPAAASVGLVPVTEALA